MAKNLVFIILGLIVAVAVVIFVLPQFGVQLPSFLGIPGTQAPAPSAKAPDTTSLGGSIYNSVSNPVSEQLPQNTAPVPNPVENVYKNPFDLIK